MTLWIRGLFSLFCKPHPTHISCHTFSYFCLSSLVPPLFPFTLITHSALFTICIASSCFSLTLSLCLPHHSLCPYFISLFLSLFLLSLSLSFFISLFLSLSLIVSVFFISFPHSTAFAREQISAISS